MRGGVGRIGRKSAVRRGASFPSRRGKNATPVKKTSRIGVKIPSSPTFAHEGLVRKIVRRRAPWADRHTQEDLHQVGRIAAWHAARRFDPRKGRFSTLAQRHIEGAVGRSLKRQGAVHIGERSVRKLAARGELDRYRGVSLEAAAGHSTHGGIPAREAALHLRSIHRHLDTREKQLVGFLAKDIPKGVIARRLGVSQGRVSQMLTAMRKKLREREAA